MDIQQTRSRLRRTFAYPSDAPSPHDDDDDAALDEQEQEELITSLTTQNHTANARFRLFLLLLPLLSAAPYLIALFSSSSSAARRGPSHVLALLALTSLASTAWLLYAQLPGTTGLAALDRWAAGAGARDTLHGDHGAHIPTPRRHRRGSFSVPDAVPAGEGAGASAAGPLATWLPYLNVGLCAVLVVAGLVAPASVGGASGHGGGGGSWGHVGLNNLPAVVYAVVLLAKMVMGGVDPERELSGLKYEYKGA